MKSTGASPSVGAARAADVHGASLSRAAGPHRICRSGRHCLALTGMTPDGRCLMCRRESHNRAVDRYRGTARGMLTDINHERRRGAHK